MVSMLTVALRRAGMAWKVESLEYVVFGLRQNQGAQSLVCELGDDICMRAGDPSLPYQLRDAVVLPRKSECDILGVNFVTNPKDFHAVRHRIDADRRCFYADTKFYRSRAVSMREQFR
eukprot:4300879-Pyramimonas_sp.AAC.1